MSCPSRMEWSSCVLIRLIRIHDVQPSGKTRMSSAQWARGRGVAIGDKFGA